MRTAARQLLWMLLLPGFWLGSGSRLPAQKVDPVADYALKATYLSLFISTTTWRMDAFADAKSPLVVGILGSDPWRGGLAKKLGAVIKQRKVEVIKCADNAAARQCHLLFISKSEKARLSQILNELKESKVFTVVEADRAAETDGVFIWNRARMKAGCD